MVRTNCLDCLDRTNFTQAHISNLVLTHILNYLLDAQRKNDPHGSTQWDAGSQKIEAEQALQRMWNENGDKLSNQYAGTQSNISGALTEEGNKQGIASKFGKLVTGVQRFLVNNFSDPDKQQSINILMGQHPE